MVVLGRTTKEPLAAPSVRNVQKGNEKKKNDMLLFVVVRIETCSREETTDVEELYKSAKFSVPDTIPA